MKAWEKFLTTLRLLICGDYFDYRAVRSLGVFDSEYYFSFLPEGVARSEDPLRSYFLHWRLNDDGVHNMQQSWRQLPDPHPQFDTCYYLNRYFPNGLRRNPFAHYLLEGWRDGYQPGPFFDAQTYRQWSEWREERGNPLVHYHRSGRFQGKSPSPLFDIDWYVDRTAALLPARDWIIRHYKLYGAVDGRKSPIPVFDPIYYLSQLKSSGHARRDPLAHFCSTDPAGSKRPNEWFDPLYYRKSAMDEGDLTSPLVHYLSKGVFAGRYTDERIARLPEKPIFSIIIPVYNSNLHFLNNCIRSVLYQVYPNWELCLVDDCSSDDRIREILVRWSGKDRRIKTAFHDCNGGISAATRTGVSLASGDYLGFLDHDDELTVDCLYRFALEINATRPLFLYSDEDLIGDDSSRLSVFYKSGFNHQLLFSHNYITHFVVVETDFFHRIGGVGTAYDGAQDYDLALRAAEQTDRITHIPKILYHWRASDSSTSIRHDEKPYAHQAGRRALAASLQRLNINAIAEDSEHVFHYRATYKRSKTPSVAVLIWREDAEPAIADQRLKLIDKSGYSRCEIITVSQRRPGVSGRHVTKSAVLHDAIANCDQDYVALMGSGLNDISFGWLDALLNLVLADSNCGIACGRIAYGGEDGASFTVPDITNANTWYFAEALCSMSRHLNGLHNSQLVRCCSWGLCVFSRTLYEQIGGFDYQQFSDVLAMPDFALSVTRSGRKISYTPTAVADVGRMLTEDSLPEKKEKHVFQQKWRSMLGQPDPYYNCNCLADQGVSEVQLLKWLTGTAEERLDASGNLH